MEDLSKKVAETQITGTTSEISGIQKEGTNLKAQNRENIKAYKQELKTDEDLTPPFKTDNVTSDGLTVFRFGKPDGILFFFTIPKESENIMIGHFTPMSEVPRRPKNEYSKTLITAFNKLLQRKRIANPNTTIDKPSKIYDNEFNDCIISVMSDVTIDTIITTLQQIKLNSPLPTTPSASASASAPSSNDLDVVEAPQTNIMDKLQKAITRFNQFIQMSLSTSTVSYIVKREQYEAVVLAMWQKIYELNSSSSKTEAQNNLIRTLLLMLLNVIQTWASKHPREPMTLKITKNKEGNNIPGDFLIPDGQWRPVTESIKGLDAYTALMTNIKKERSDIKHPPGSIGNMFSKWTKGIGGRKTRKAKRRKTRRSRKAKRRKTRR